MKTLIRLAIILLVALAVVGITYGVSQSTWVTQQFGALPAAGEGGGRPIMTASLADASLAATFGARPDGGGEQRGGHESGFNADTLMAFVRILLPVALMIAGVTLLRSLAGWLGRRRAQTQPVPAR